MIHSFPDPQSATQWCAERRARGCTIGYVPTMGALHRGHLSLVERAVRENEVACASIFINPLQFNAPDDLEKYPRDWARDLKLLEGVGCAMVYGGMLSDFFPEGRDAIKIDRNDGGLGARGLEGVHRPGHLPGVCTIVRRLFATVGCCTAYFGEKDFQQTLVIRYLAEPLDDIRIVVCPTVREASGLAMSSRNRKLNDAEQIVAAQIYQAMRTARRAWHDGIRCANELESVMRDYLRDSSTDNLRNKSLRVEYIAVRDPKNWSEDSPPGVLSQARALLAGYVGEVRLIDTLALDEQDA